MRQVLSDVQAKFLREEKEALAEMRVALAGLDLPRASLDTLQQATLQLDELFLLVVVGEFNAGKSALMNALLGEKVLAEGVTPTTSRVTLVKWGVDVAESVVDEGFAVFTHPLPLLRELNIVDTPGTNAVIRRHERLTNEFVPRSDLVLFATSADRPLTESERQFLERIRDWGKKVVLVLNKADIFEDAAALEQVRGFVLRHAAEVLGFEPEFFPVSARLAQRASRAVDPEEGLRLRAASRLDALEQYIQATLDDTTRLRLKLTNPLGVAEHLIRQAQTAAQEQDDALREDGETVTALETVLTAYEKDLNSELAPRLAEVENILVRLQERGLDFFDRTMRLLNIPTLARGDKVRAAFEKEVLADVPQQIEAKVQRLIDWLVQKDLHQWQQIMAYLQQRQARYTEHLVGAGAAPLDARRRELIDSVGRTAQTIVETYNRDEEARALAAGVESAVAQVALMEVGAIGLGALVLTVLTSTALDVTGVLAAGALAVLGFFVIPYKRRRAKDEYREKISALRNRLVTALTTQFNAEAENAVARMQTGVRPYTRFVQAERSRVDQTLTQLGALRQKVSGLKARAQNL
ncbi:MAG: dynamin family protein [Anaerolineales bacterium]|nr:dynamin family protein [Anaerolineales bacterium]